MKILFIHQNFPGQFKYLAPALAKSGHDVTALTLLKTADSEWSGVKLVHYSLSRGNAKDAHPWSVDFESKVIRGEACLRAAVKMKSKGYSPQIIVAHPGWGESLFLKEIWPDAQLKLYCEFFYHTQDADVGFDPEFPSDPLSAGRVTLKNANMLLQFQQADAGISPTLWQASTFPKHIRDKITIIHDGIDTQVVKPNQDAQFAMASGKVLTRKDEIITFVNRSLEPYRGFHVFMRSLPAVLSQQPNALVLIVGAEGVSYGSEPSNGISWKQQFINEVYPNLDDLQRTRVHFLDNIAYDRFISLLQISTVHVYLTYPFVLSWSLLEAMSAGCSIVASDTQPLREAITHDENGVLVNFFDVEALSVAIIQLLNDPAKRAFLAKRARHFAIKNYDLQTVCLPNQMLWVEA